MHNNLFLNSEEIPTPDKGENGCCRLANHSSFEEKHYDNNDGRKSPLFFKMLEKKWENYKPLIIIFIFCIILSWAQNNLETHQIETIMHSFMGYFFIFLSLFKFFDLKGFVNGFSTYDLIAKRVRLSIYGVFLRYCLPYKI